MSKREDILFAIQDSGEDFPAIAAIFVPDVTDLDVQQIAESEGWKTYTREISPKHLGVCGFRLGKLERLWSLANEDEKKELSLALVKWEVVVKKGGSNE